MINYSMGTGMWMVLVLLHVVLGNGSGTTTQRVQHMETQEYLYSAVVITTPFPEGVFIRVPPCFDAPSKIISPRFECFNCNISGNVTDDQGGDVFNFTKIVSLHSSLTYPPTVTEIVNTTIVNYDTCNARIILMLEHVQGDYTLLLTAGTFQQWLYYVDDLNWVQPFVFCCQELRELAGQSWDGSLLITAVMSSLKVSFLLYVPTNLTSLPLSLYYPIVPVVVTTDKDVSFIKGAPVNVPATFDPFLSFWINQMPFRYNWINLTAAPFSISTVIWESRSPKPLYNVKAENFGIPGILQSSGFSYSYDWIVDSNGNPYDTIFNVTTATIENCDYESFALVSSMFTTIVEVLHSIEISESTDILALIQLATSVVKSFSWQSCLTEALMYLDETAKTQKYFGPYCLYGEGSQEWEDDPCCNLELLSTRCCRNSNTSVTEKIYTMDNDSPFGLPPNCQNQRCLGQQLDILATQVNPGYITACMEKTEEDYSYDPWSYCSAVTITPKSCYIDASCSSLIPNSVCDVVGAVQPRGSTCTIPCDPLSGCILGTCQFSPLGWVCLDLDTKTKNETEHAFVQCLMSEVDPRIRDSIVEQVTADPRYLPHLPLLENLKEMLKVAACIGPDGTPWPGTFSNLGWIPDEEACGNIKGLCPICGCNLDDTDFGPSCVVQCFAPITSGGACGWDYSTYIAVRVSRPNLCEIRVDESTEAAYARSNELCSEHDGIWIGASRLPNRLFGSCLKFGPPDGPIDDPNDCYTSDCIPNMMGDGVHCLSYCYDPSVTTPASCNFTNATLSSRWYTWDNNTSNDASVVNPLGNRCVMLDPTGKNLELPACSSPYVWFAGLVWLPALLNSKEECERGLCAYTNGQWDYTAPDEVTCAQDGCTSCYNYNWPTNDIRIVQPTQTPECRNKSVCEATMACNNFGGCAYNGTLITQLGLGVNLRWTPNGSFAQASPDICDLGVSAGFAFFYSYEPIQTVQDCLAWKSICNEQPLDNGTPYDSPVMPAGWSERNEYECDICGGEVEPFWEWVPGKWGQQRYFVNTTWYPADSYVIKPTWGLRWADEQWTKYLSTAEANTLATISINQLLCIYGAQQAVLGTISCACNNGDQSCLDTMGGLNGVITGYVSMCEGIPSVNFLQSATLNVTRDFKFLQNTSSSQCTPVHVGLVPLQQFTEQRTLLLTSLAIYSESQLKRQEFIFVNNQQNPPVVVGQVISDGIEFLLDEQRLLSGVEVCIPIPNITNVTWQLHESMARLDVVAAYNSYTQFILFDLNLPLSAHNACVPLNGTNQTFFIVALVANAQELEIKDTWLPQELGFLIFIIVAYTILLCFNVFALATRFMALHYPELSSREGISYPEATLGLLLFQCTLRVIYFHGVPFGVFEATNLSLLFSDLPLLLFHCSVIITGLMSSEASSNARHPSGDSVRRVVRSSWLAWLTTSTLILCYVVLAIAYGIERYKTKHITCTTTDQERTQELPATIISLVYSVIFVIYSIFIAAIFARQAYHIIILLITNPNKAIRKLGRTFSIVSLLAIIGLLIQAAAQIYTAVNQLENTTKLALILVAEIIPTYLLVYLYKFEKLRKLTCLILNRPYTTTNRTTSEGDTGSTTTTANSQI